MATVQKKKEGHGAGVILLAATAAFASLLLLTKAASVPPPPPGQTPTTLDLTAQSDDIAVNQADSVVATLLDQNGNAITGYPVSLSTGSGTAPAATTDSNGNATWSVSYPNPGSYSLQASV